MKKQVQKYADTKARRKTAKKREALGKQGKLDNLRAAFTGPGKLIK